MKKIFAVTLAAGLTLSAACSDYLDVNTNPNGPQTVTANLYLPPMLHWMVTAPQFDGRFVGRYTQEWALSNGQTAPGTGWAIPPATTAASSGVTCTGRSART